MNNQDIAAIGKLRLKHSMLVACMAASHGTSDYRYFRKYAMQCRVAMRALANRIRASA